jgi:hypothetical protein
MLSKFGLESQGHTSIRAQTTLLDMRRLFEPPVIGHVLQGEDSLLLLAAVYMQKPTCNYAWWLIDGVGAGTLATG